MTKAWIEMLHRYFAMGIGLLIIILTVQAWRRARLDRAAPSPWLATGALVWVCVQGAFGAWTVTMKLQPVVVTAHLLGGIALLALLVALALRETPSQPVAADARRLRPLALVALAVRDHASCAGRMGQQQLRSTRVPGFPQVPERLDACDGLRARVYAVAGPWDDR